jgi:hypothetical protein
MESGGDRTMDRKYVKGKLAYELHWIECSTRTPPSLEICTVPTLDDAQIAFRQIKSEYGNRFRTVKVDAIEIWEKSKLHKVCFSRTPAFLSRA